MKDETLLAQVPSDVKGFAESADIPVRDAAIITDLLTSDHGHKGGKSLWRSVETQLARWKIPPEHFFRLCRAGGDTYMKFIFELCYEKYILPAIPALFRALVEKIQGPDASPLYAKLILQVSSVYVPELKAKTPNVEHKHLHFEHMDKTQLTAEVNRMQRGILELSKEMNPNGASVPNGSREQANPPATGKAP